MIAALVSWLDCASCDVRPISSQCLSRSTRSTRRDRSQDGDLYQMLHYLSYIDDVLYGACLLQIVPADVSAVARSTLEFFKCLLLVVQACISKRICVWLYFSSFRAGSLSSLSIVVLSFPGTQQSELLNRTPPVSSVSWKEHIALVAVQVLTVTRPRLLLPWPVEKNRTMRQQAYYCVICAASRHQCTVNTPTKRSCHTVCWLNFLRTWEIPAIMTSYINELTLFLIFNAINQLLFTAANLNV